MESEEEAFETTPNFRHVSGTLLFRSSQPDNMTEEEIQRIKELGIKSFIDLRSPKSWEEVKERGHKLLDNYYAPLVVKPDKYGELHMTNLHTGVASDTDSGATCGEESQHSEKLGHHYYVNMVDVEYAFGIIREAPWYRQAQLVGYGITYFTLGHRAVLKKVSEWCIKKPGEPMVLSLNKSMVKYSGMRTNAGSHFKY